MYEIAKIRVPEYAGKGNSRTDVPAVYAVDKHAHIENNRKKIAEMDKRIAQLERLIAVSKSKDAPEYYANVKRLAKCRQIKEDCEYSIALMTMQIKLETAKPARRR